MELPRKLPEGREHKRILGEFYDLYKNRPWFYRAELMEMHPDHLKPTLQVYCDFEPALERKEIVQFAATYNLALEIIIRPNKK
jgi:hypothetical protein